MVAGDVEHDGLAVLIFPDADQVGRVEIRWRMVENAPVRPDHDAQRSRVLDRDLHVLRFAVSERRIRDPVEHRVDLVLTDARPARPGSVLDVDHARSV